MVNSAICTKPLPAPPSVDAKLFKSFGVEVVSGFDPTDFTPEQFIELERLLYEHDVVLFRGLDLAPEHQYKLTKAFDPTCESYGHGNNQVRACVGGVCSQTTLLWVHPCRSVSFM